MSENTNRKRRAAGDVVFEQAVVDVVQVEDESYTSEPAPTQVSTAVIKVAPVEVVNGRWRLEWVDENGLLRQGWSDTYLDSAPLDRLAGLEPYGDDLTVLFDAVSITPEQIAEWLHRAGVWTYKDVTTRVLRDVFAGLAQDLSTSVHARKGELRRQVA